MRRGLAALPWCTLLMLAACGRPAAPVASRSAAPPSAVLDPGADRLFEGLGTHGRPVTTASRDAQRFFDQGLAFVYAFNHDEAARSFRRAAELDPRCAMAWWGVAYAQGPHINFPAVPPDRARVALDALARAREAAAGATPVERALIEALAARHADPPPADRRPLDLAYADAMRAVARAHPADADVGALFAEALMDLRPWDLWGADGKPRPETPEVLATLEAVLARDPRHPLANHLYIHAVEASPHPGKADRAADVLRDLQPGLGHLVHMPSHIDVRRGRWVQAIEANRKAIEADRRYRAVRPDQGFYQVYMAHNRHMLTYAAMMTGQGALALRTIRAMVDGIPPEFLRRNALIADGFAAMPLEVLMRFGKWDDLLAVPEFPDYLPLSRALRHAARGIALAARDRLDEARAEEAAFRAASVRVPAEATFGNNAAADILGVAGELVRGEILYRAGREDEGLEALREAVRREDALRYDEPPDWIQPVRHALGAALTESKRYDEAEAVFREDQRRLPGNGWSLFGLARVLQESGRKDEAAEVRMRFDAAWKDADVSLDAACFCQSGV